MQTTLIILFVINIIYSIGLTIAVFKKKPQKEVNDIWKQLNKMMDFNIGTAAIVDKNILNIKIAGKNQEAFHENQKTFYADIKKLCLDLKQVKNELASTQVFLMDKVINGESE